MRFELLVCALSGGVVRVQRKSFCGPKTAGLIAGIVGGVVLLLGIAVASAYGTLLG